MPAELKQAESCGSMDNAPRRTQQEYLLMAQMARPY